MDFNYRGSGAVDRPFMAPSEGSGLTRSWRREFLHRNRDHPEYDDAARRDQLDPDFWDDLLKASAVCDA